MCGDPSHCPSAAVKVAQRPQGRPQQPQGAPAAIDAQNPQLRIQQAQQPEVAPVAENAQKPQRIQHFQLDETPVAENAQDPQWRIQQANVGPQARPQQLEEAPAGENAQNPQGRTQQANKGPQGRPQQLQAPQAHVQQGPAATTPRAAEAADCLEGVGELVCHPSAATTLQHEMQKDTSLPQGVLTHKERSTAASFIQAPQDYFDAELTAKQPYAPQPGEILGTLKQMNETFETIRAPPQKEEMANQKAYEYPKAAKEGEIASVQAQVNAKAQELAYTEEALAQSRQDVVDTKAPLALRPTQKPGQNAPPLLSACAAKVPHSFGPHVSSPYFWRPCSASLMCFAAAATWFTWFFSPRWRFRKRSQALGSPPRAITPGSSPVSWSCETTAATASVAGWWYGGWHAESDGDMTDDRRGCVPCTRTRAHTHHPHPHPHAPPAHTPACATCTRTRTHTYPHAPPAPAHTPRAHTRTHTHRKN